MVQGLKVISQIHDRIDFCLNARGANATLPSFFLAKKKGDDR
jgi:hypothetical protein